MKIRLRIDVNRLTWDQYCRLEDGKVTMAAARDLVATFMIDDQGGWVEYKDAYKQLGALRTPEIMEALELLRAEFDKMRTAVLPLASERPSSSPSGTEGQAPGGTGS
jgi:hypothetical protein